MARVKVLVAQVLATLLFAFNYNQLSQGAWFAWLTPMVLVALIALNSFWFSRFVSWVIFAAAFFAFCSLLSAFTIRWRGETGFDSKPFYMAMSMYVAFIYACLGQIKLAGGKPS